MLGLGTPIQVSSNAAIQSERAGTAWTETSHASGTTPNIRAGGTPTQTIISLFIDNANDWSGDITDYSLTSVEVNNVTDGVSSTGNTFTFVTDNGVSGGVREIQTDRLDFATLAGGGRNDNMTVTGNLTRAAYASPQLTISFSY